MKKNLKKILLIGFFCLIFFVFYDKASAEVLALPEPEAQNENEGTDPPEDSEQDSQEPEKKNQMTSSLVPCGPTGQMCTICHFIEMGQRIFEFLLRVSLAVAILLIAIAGILYITSSGNETMMTTAKNALKTTLIGFALCLVAWILMTAVAKTLGYVGSDNWWSIEIDCESKTEEEEEDQTSEENPENCPPVEVGPCSEENLKNTCFGEEANEASGICNKESGGIETAESSTDKCIEDGNVFSVGLFQINLTVHDMPDVDNSSTLDCPEAFNHSAQYDSSNQGYHCKVVDQQLYNKCVQAAKNPKNNIAKACELFDQRKWDDWGKCGGNWGSNSKCCFE